jgi:hypothetical protein
MYTDNFEVQVSSAVIEPVSITWLVGESFLNNVTTLDRFLLATAVDINRLYKICSRSNGPLEYYRKETTARHQTKERQRSRTARRRY